jgi:ferredoxin/flavodoxin---NADP+ reductase
MAENNSGHLVVVVGAGPAGIYGSRKLADAGHEVVLINRDIKPGGLVEYGIYWNKHKMKEGIRNQFRKILADPRVHYVGNVKVGEQADLTLNELREVLNPSALIVAAGAQGTKSLGLKGEEAQGVFHAKDLVYHYNGLPPFSQRQFAIGKRVAIIGIGNVMVDIAHWLVHDLKTPEVIAVARRGPAQRAYTDNEIKAVAANIDQAAFQQELDRCAPHIHLDSEGLTKLHLELTKYCKEPCKEGISPTKLTFRYLSAPTEILSDEMGRVRALRMEDTTLVPKGEDFSARGLGTFHELEVDTGCRLTAQSTSRTPRLTRSIPAMRRIRSLIRKQAKRSPAPSSSAGRAKPLMDWSARPNRMASAASRWSTVTSKRKRPALRPIWQTG